MRVFPMIACVALALSACGEKDSAEQSANGSQGITTESIGGNDLTAIDAATSSDANMAADVDYNAIDLNELNAAADNEAADEE